MASTGIIGDGGSAGFILGPVQNTFDAGAGDKSAAETLRDDYEGANPSWLAQYDADSSIGIYLLYQDGGDPIALAQVRQGSVWRDFAVFAGVRGVQGEDGGATNFSGITVEGQIPSLSSDLVNYEYSGATVGPTDEITFDGSINVPAGSVNVGAVLQLSEGIADLVVVDLLKKEMAFSVNSPFADSTGAGVPFYIDFGGPQSIVLQPTDTTVITTNPLIFSATGAVTPPNTRLIDRLVLRANGAMNNVRARIIDNATGLVLRYVPSKAVFDSGAGGLDFIAGDNTIFLASDAVDTAGNFHLGYQPFFIENGQQVDFTVEGDSIDLLGNVSEIPYLEIEAHDGSVTELAASPGGVDTNVQFNDGDAFGGENSLTYTRPSDDRFLNVKMVTAFDGEVGLRIQNELNVDRTTLTYEGNFEETYFNTYGSGGLIATIGAGDCVWQMNSSSANFKINGTASPDTDDIFSIVAAGANGGAANFHVTSRNPEGVLNKPFGHFALRVDGVNTGFYAKKSVGVSTTDWYPFPTAPQTTVVNAAATYANTTGDELLSVDTVQISAGATSSSVTVDTVTAAGLADIALRNNVGAARFITEYSQSTDTSRIIDSSANGLDIRPSSGNVNLETTVASDFVLNAKSPSATGTVSVILRDSADAARLTQSYDGNTGACSVNLDSNLLLGTTSSESSVVIRSPSVSGDAKIALEDSGVSEAFAIRYLETSDVVQILTNRNNTFSNIAASGTFTFSHGVTGGTTFTTTGTFANAPIALETTGTSGSLSNIFISDVSPQNGIPGNLGDVCIKGDLSDPDSSKIYIHGDGTDTDDDWWFMPTVYEGVSEHLTLSSHTPSASASISLKSFTASRQASLQYDDSTGNALLELAAPSGAEINSPLSFLLIHAEDDEIRLRRGDTGVTGEILNIQNLTTSFGVHANTATPEGSLSGTPGSVAAEVNGVDSGWYVHAGSTSGTAGWVNCVGGSSLIMFGDAAIAGTTATRYLTPGHDSGTAQTSPIQMVMPRDGYIKNLYIVHNTTAGNGNDIVYTARINSVTTALAVTLASTTAQGSDTTDRIVVSAGDLIDIEITKASSIGTSPSNVQATLEYM